MLSAGLSRAPEEPDPNHKMTAFIAQELQKLRCAGHIVNRGRIGLAGGIVYAAAQREAISVERHHAFDRQVQVEIQGIAVGIHFSDDHAGLVPHRKWIPAPHIGEHGDGPVLPREWKIRPCK